jgi:putative polyhydroxyalkanoate system protein
LQSQSETAVPNISIRRAHDLSRKRAVEAVDAIAARLKGEYSLKSHWRDATLHFEGAGLTGTLHVAAKEVVIEMQLGFLLSALRGSIITAVERTLDEELAAKPTRGSRGK